MRIIIYSMLTVAFLIFLFIVLFATAWGGAHCTDCAAVRGAWPFLKTFVPGLVIYVGLVVGAETAFRASERR